MCMCISRFAATMYISRFAATMYVFTRRPRLSNKTGAAFSNPTTQQLAPTRDQKPRPVRAPLRHSAGILPLHRLERRRLSKDEHPVSRVQHRVRPGTGVHVRLGRVARATGAQQGKRHAPEKSVAWKLYDSTKYAYMHVFELMSAV